MYLSFGTKREKAEMVWAEFTTRQAIANLPSEARKNCSRQGMAWRWQVFGLAGELDATPVEFLLTQASRSVRGAVLVRAFVPAYRCGAVPELHRVPFRRSLHGKRHQLTTAIYGVDRAASSQM